MVELEDTPNMEQAKKSYTRLGLALFVMGIASIGLQRLLALLAKQSGLTDRGWLIWALSVAPLYLVGMPLCLLIMKKVPTYVPEKIKLGGKNFFLFLLMSFPLMYGGNLIGTLLSKLLSGGTAQNRLVNYVFDDSPLKILIVVILAPLLEEFIFRKQLIDRCSQYGEKTAILFSGLTFGLFHMNLYQFFYAFGIGLLFAYVYIRTRKFWYSAVMHMIINFNGSVLVPLTLSLADPEVVQQLINGTLDNDALLAALPSLVPYLLYFVAMIGLSVAGLVLLLTKMKKFVFLTSPEEVPKEQRFKVVYGNIGVILFSVFCIVMFIFNLLK